MENKPKENILVIDDDLSILEGFKELLTIEGFKVDTAANEREAMLNLKSKEYKVVIMDIVLKETTGIELISKIREIQENIVIIMITAYPSTESAIQCFRSGAYDYLIKPIKKNELLHAIKRGLAHKQGEQEINGLLRIKETAQKANMEKTIFLSQVSHDIHAIMDGIIGHNNILLKTKIDEKQAESLSAIKMSCNFLRNLADNILDIARVEVGKLNLKEVDFDLAELVMDVSKIIYPSIKQKPVQFSYAIERDVPKILNGDPDRLRQILLNLVSNAVKFTKEGEIDLQIKLMTSLEDSCHVFFIVRDTGPGIPREQQMEIFKPFFQIEKQFDVKKPASKKTAQESNGLGLWICKVLVERMGGLISLHSEPGKGCEFRFSIRFNLSVNKPNN